MTHLSDYSYLDRLIFNLFAFPWILYHAFVDHKTLNDLQNGNKKRFLVFMFYVLAYCFGISYDILATRLKYNEGFVDTCLIDKSSNQTTIFRYPKEAFEHVQMYEGSPFQYEGPMRINASFTNAGNCGIKQTPSGLYNEENKHVLPTIDLLWNLQCTFRNSGIFMMLAWFNSTVKMFFNKPCLTKCEQRTFEFYSFLSLGSYFVLPQIIMSPLLSTISSQLLWSIELFFACCFLMIANHRMDKMVQEQLVSAMQSGSEVGNATKAIFHIKTMNSALAIVAFIEGFGLFALNIDILFVEWRVLYASKLLTDIFTRLFNFGYVLEPLVVAIIIYKPHFLQIKERVRKRKNRIFTSTSPTGSKRDTSFVNTAIQSTTSQKESEKRPESPTSAKLLEEC